MNLGMTPSEYQALQESGKALPAAPLHSAPVVPQPVQQLNERERMVQSLAKEFAGKSRAELQSTLGMGLGAEVADAMQSQPLTAQQAYGKRQRAERAANAEFRKDLAAAGIQVQQHSENEYTQVIVKQLDLQLEGVNPSVNALLHAVFPDDPKKATSIGNSTRKDRRKKAFNSEAVRNHPIEVAMQLTHGRGSMNQRCSTGTFRQSLGIGRTLFKSCDRITKLEARVQLLEQQMESTKNREALADAGATSSRDKVLALTHEGKGPSEIAELLDMPYETVRTIRRRSKQ